MMKLDKEYFFLPKKYWKQHDQCELILRQIEDFVTDGTYKELKMQKINLSSKPEFRNNENVLDFLLRTDRVDAHDKLVMNSLIYALIADVSYFLQEAILCSKKKRLSVTFALLRKPFVYHLIVFLRIMFEDDFMKKFNFQDSFDSTALKEEDKRDLIKQSLPFLFAARSLTEDDLYDSIFNQDNPNSIVNISNKALHLSTTRYKNNKTEIQNLNFIFANQRDIVKLWDYLYIQLPALFLYYVEIIDALVFSIVDLPEQTYTNRIKERLDFLSK